MDKSVYKCGYWPFSVDNSMGYVTAGGAEGYGLLAAKTQKAPCDYTKGTRKSIGVHCADRNPLCRRRILFAPFAFLRPNNSYPNWFFSSKNPRADALGLVPLYLRLTIGRVLRQSNRGNR